MNVQNIRPPLSPNSLQELRNGVKPAAAQNQPEVSFNQMLDSLNKSQGDSDALIQKLAAGEEVDLHQVMIASEQTDISFRVALAIRDKLVEAYREVMRMSV